LKIKDGVKIQGLHISMQPILKAAGHIWSQLGQELVVTCGMDGMHSAGSLHYYGRAVDLRTRYFDDSEKNVAQQALQEALGECYDVVLEDSHMHVEYDLPPVSEVERKYYRLLMAAYTVCERDWSDNDSGSVRDVQTLRNVIEFNEGK